MDPELKEIFKECFKRFQRDLLREIFSLKEQLKAPAPPGSGVGCAPGLAGQTLRPGRAIPYTYLLRIGRANAKI